MNIEKRKRIKKLVWRLIPLVLIVVLVVSCNRSMTPPNLQLTLVTDNTASRNIRAILVAHNWRWYLIPISSHSQMDTLDFLQFFPDRFDNATFYLDNELNEIRLQFRSNNQPDHIRVRRWRIEPTICLRDGEHEHVSTWSNMILVEHDGYDYLYEVFARWGERFSYYTFRVNSSID